MINLSPTLLLKPLKPWQLKLCAFWVGASTTGSKPVLEASIDHQMRNLEPSDSPRRILSVDMGIRNLAYCVIDIPESRDPEAPKGGLVKAWKRLDLVEDLAAFHAKDSGSITRADEKSAFNALFTPANLAHTALSISEQLLRHDVNTILIERQRFRSGGAAAIQEWTVRVNMLESMLWACLTTLRASKSTTSFPTVHPVNPSRVATFWTADKDTDLETNASQLAIGGRLAPPKDPTAKTGRKKIEKKDKIAVVQSWFRADGPMDLQFCGEAKVLADDFRLKKPSTKKLDDLADCLLQGLAWARWQDNSKSILRTLAQPNS